MARTRSAGAQAGRIRAGIGGWTYAPWRGTFYPPGLPHARELAHASQRLGAIEVNGTFYRTFGPKVFASWREQTPDGFVFSLKAPRYATNRRVLAEAGESIARFVGSGIAELGPKLGPLSWQLPPTKRFEPDDLARFLALLPPQVAGQPLRHVLEVRHESFRDAAYLALARKHGVATVFTDSEDYPSFADLTGSFVYARLMRSDARCKTGYAAKALDAWAARARTWASGGEPDDLPRIAPARGESTPREVFVFFINGAKERAPAAAQALIRQLEKAL
ncbi:MAG TPA: DUF72 domain-containing protein [Candidatus Binatia bacterium]|nr:DUF72 domain-containing protein [Candidatus Binatia bacterium]